MKIRFIKQAGGVLVPADDREAERMTRFKTGEEYSADIKQMRNPSFHRKVFAFLNFCFEHWECPDKYKSEQAQFDKFRKELTILAGYRKELWSIKGEVRFEAESLSYGNMEQEEFEQCYIALTNAAMRTIFKGAGEETYNQLLSFF